MLRPIFTYWDLCNRYISTEVASGQLFTLKLWRFCVVLLDDLIRIIFCIRIKRIVVSWHVVLQLMMHDYNDVPKMAEKGTSVSPGLRSFISLETTQVVVPSLSIVYVNPCRFALYLKTIHLLLPPKSQGVPRILQAERRAPQSIGVAKIFYAGVHFF